jgi:hypothetical protein
MAKTDTALAVEFDGKQNQNFYFGPLGLIRGRFDLHRVAEPNAGKLHARWPEPIPGQRLEYDFATGAGAVVEPLYEEKFAAIRERIEALGQKLPEQRRAFALDAATLAHWLKGLIATGDAKLVAGVIPEVQGKPQTRFHSSEQLDPLDKLTAAIEKQNELQAQLVAAIGELAKR